MSLYLVDIAWRLACMQICDAMSALLWVPATPWTPWVQLGSTTPCCNYYFMQSRIPPHHLMSYTMQQVNVVWLVWCIGWAQGFWRQILPCMHFYRHTLAATRRLMYSTGTPPTNIAYEIMNIVAKLGHQGECTRLCKVGLANWCQPPISRCSTPPH